MSTKFDNIKIMIRYANKFTVLFDSLAIFDTTSFTHFTLSLARVEPRA